MRVWNEGILWSMTVLNQIDPHYPVLDYEEIKAPDFIKLIKHLYGKEISINDVLIAAAKMHYEINFEECRFSASTYEVNYLLHFCEHMDRFGITNKRAVIECFLDLIRHHPKYTLTAHHLR